MYSAPAKRKSTMRTIQRAVGSKVVANAPRGHGVRERDRQLDASRRTIGRFDGCLRLPR